MEVNMLKAVPIDFMDLLVKPAYGHLATLMPDGGPQVSPIWVDYDRTYLMINSARGRVKDLNMRRDSRVAVEVQDPDNPYRYILFRGNVVEITEDGADAHIDKLSMKYTGKPYQWRVPGQIRVIYKILPDSITTSGR
jgi:PPOX class probable F420-dependent enzyme